MGRAPAGEGLPAAAAEPIEGEVMKAGRLAGDALPEGLPQGWPTALAPRPRPWRGGGLVVSRPRPATVLVVEDERGIREGLGTAVESLAALPDALRGRPPRPSPGPRPSPDEEALSGLTLREAVADLEKRMITAALGRAKGNRSEAARQLGIARTQLYAKMQEHGLAPKGERGLPLPGWTPTATTPCSARWWWSACSSRRG